jgi:hypothetical protein
MRTPQPGYNTKVHATVSLAREELEQIKTLAIWRGTNVSHMLADWIRREWAEVKQGQVVQQQQG